MKVTRRTYLIALLCIAFLLRLGAVAGLRDIRKFHGPNAAGADAVEFNAIALNLASANQYAVTQGHPTSFRAPGFPLLLAAIYSISFANYALAYVFLCLLGAATCLLTYAAARELVTETLARIAGALTAFYVPHIYFSTVFLSETLFAFCVALGLWLMLRGVRSGSLWAVFGAALTIGYAALTRPMALLIPACWVPALWFAASSRRRALAQVVVLGIGVAGAILPWSIRNYAVFHRPVLIATNGGSTFYGSNNDTVLRDARYLGSWISTVSLPGRQTVENAPDEPSHDQIEWALGKQWVSAHLTEMPKLLAYKMARFVLPETASGNRRFVMISAAGYLPIAALFLAGIVALLLQRPAAASPCWLFAHGILAADIASSLIFYGSARFRDGIAPALMLYAAVGCGLLLRVRRPAVEQLAGKARGAAA